MTARVWLTAALVAFIFLLGCSVGHGCAGHATPEAPRSDTVTVQLPAPPAVHDTVPRQVIRWLHDTVWSDSGSVRVPVALSCEAFDTVTTAGTRVDFRQCFALPDSIIRPAIRPPVLTIQEPPPVRQVITVTVPEYRAKPINWTWELIKFGVFFGGGVYSGAHLR